MIIKYSSVVKISINIYYAEAATYKRRRIKYCA